MHDLATLQKLLDPLFPGLMGVRLTLVESDRVLAEMEVRADLCTGGGILHGGAYMAFADTLGAVGTVVNLGPGKRTTTTDSSTKFIAGARLHSVVTGECVALHRGRSMTPSLSQDVALHPHASQFGSQPADLHLLGTHDLAAGAFEFAQAISLDPVEQRLLPPRPATWPLQRCSGRRSPTARLLLEIHRIAGPYRLLPCRSPCSH